MPFLPSASQFTLKGEAAVGILPQYYAESEPRKQLEDMAYQKFNLPHSNVLILLIIQPFTSFYLQIILPVLFC
jgi:hypothetical protein